MTKLTDNPTLYISEQDLNAILTEAFCAFGPLGDNVVIGTTLSDEGGSAFVIQFANRETSDD